MMPLAIPMAQAFGIPFAIAVEAVLSGGLFGDHCSPISDTTILSSTGAECDLVEHIRTQLPYAAVNGIIPPRMYGKIRISLKNLPVIYKHDTQMSCFSAIMEKMDGKREHYDGIE